ncbi:hypothetical protein F7725_024888 [Dissostichus mawsoni]|uniref:Uncharacterized protein n=1 Tax=Dissostichus mawsoni TaxID=36200 RepID=A0A7J5X9K0_DISMA|nr:hypothetical protein F7725_024888 [Dissostichus mawsoni]
MVTHSAGQHLEDSPYRTAPTGKPLQDSRDEGWTLNSRLQAALDEAPDSPDGPGVGLILPPVDEGDEAGRVQAALRPGPFVRGFVLQPGLLDAERGWRSPSRVGPQQQADEVPGPLADALEVVPGEAEVQPADVQAGLLGTLVGGQRHRISKDQLRGGELRAAQQGVDVEGAVELHRVTEVCELHRRLAAGAVGHQQDEGVAAGGFVRVDQADYVGVLQPLEQVEFLRDPVPPHQLLVHLFDRHQTLGAPLVTPLHHRETTPGEKEEERQRVCQDEDFLLGHQDEAGVSQHEAGDPALGGGALLRGRPEHQEHVLLVAGQDLDHLALTDADLILLHSHVVLGHQHALGKDEKSVRLNERISVQCVCRNTTNVGG